MNPFPTADSSKYDAESGHSVVEATIAAALLVAVLVPAVGLISYAAVQHSQRTAIEAHAVAQDAMETMLHRRASGAPVGENPVRGSAWGTSRDGERSKPADRWILRRDVEQTDAGTTRLRVRVWRRTPFAADASHDEQSTLPTMSHPDRDPDAVLITERWLTQDQQ
jgi:hypothetical protein